MGPIDERRRESCFLACLYIGKPGTSLLITIGSMNIHQDNFYHLLDPHIPSRLEDGRTYRPSHHSEAILPRL